MHSFFFFFSSRRRHTISLCDWSSDVCSSDLTTTTPGKPGVVVVSGDASPRITHGRFRPQLGKHGSPAPPLPPGVRSEERRVGKSVDLGGRRIIKKKKKKNKNKWSNKKEKMMK